MKIWSLVSMTILIIIGLSILGVNFGMVPPDIWRLWPLVLVGLGVWLIWIALTRLKEAVPIPVPSLRMEGLFKGGRDGSITGGMTLLFMGIGILGASLGWWNWIGAGAALFLGAGLGLLIDAILARPKEVVPTPVPSLRMEGLFERGRDGSVTDGITVLFTGIGILGASLGWWNWIGAGAALFLGAGLGLLIDAILGWRE
jgi:hypothetical protein